MKLLSVNVGFPREIEWQGKLVRTSIFKSSAAGQVRVGTLNLAGDQQSDLSVHGGIHKAVYDLLRRDSELPALPSYWRDHFRIRLFDSDS